MKWIALLVLLLVGCVGREVQIRNDAHIEWRARPCRFIAHDDTGAVVFTMTSDTAACDPPPNICPTEPPHE